MYAHVLGNAWSAAVVIIIILCPVLTGMVLALTVVTALTASIIMQVELVVCTGSPSFSR